MTQRERQILEWIRQNPMISQQELADKAGITRSSAAVHISNLMKKGYITGRGYLLRTAPYIVVIGGVNMDIGAVSAAPLVARDSNPGRVTTSLGGVGRNIAHNLCLLGEQVSMITVLGQDGFAQSVRDNAADIGLDLTHSAVIPGGHTGTYLFIDDCDGDMALAVNDMAIYDHITPDFLRQRLEFIDRAGLVVLEHGPHSGRPRVHHQGPPPEAGAGLADGPEAQPHGGGAFKRREDRNGGRCGAGGGRPAVHRLAAGVYLPGRRRRVCQKRGGGDGAGGLPQSDGAERHRRRRRHGGGAGGLHDPWPFAG